MMVMGKWLQEPGLQATAMHPWYPRVLTTLSFVDLLASLTSVRCSILDACGLHTSVGSTIIRVFLSMNLFASSMTASCFPRRVRCAAFRGRASAQIFSPTQWVL